MGFGDYNPTERRGKITGADAYRDRSNKKQLGIAYQQTQFTATSPAEPYQRGSFVGWGSYNQGWEGQANQEIELQRMMENNATKYALEVEQGTLMRDLWMIQADDKAAYEIERAAEAADMIGQYENFKQSAQMATANSAIGFLNLLGQKNKAAAIAGIALQKSIAIATTYTSTASGAQLAFASQLIPGDPTSIARAAAASAATWKMGYLNMALIAATGLMQATASGGSSMGSSSGGGTMASPMVTQPQAAEQITPKEITIIIQGNVVDQDKFAREILPSIRQAFNDEGA